MTTPAVATENGVAAVTELGNAVMIEPGIDVVATECGPVAVTGTAAVAAAMTAL